MGWWLLMPAKKPMRCVMCHVVRVDAMIAVGTEVEWRYAFDWRWERPVGSGRVVAVCDAPSVLIESPDGSKTWWRADLTRPAAEARDERCEQHGDKCYPSVDHFPRLTQEELAAAIADVIRGRTEG